MNRHCCPTCFSDEHLSPEWCPDVWIDQKTGIRVFNLLVPGRRDQLVDTREAYDDTQTNEDIRDGDVVICRDGERTVYAVLVEAWPVAFDGLDEEGRAGQLHVLDHPSDIYSLGGGKYAASVDAANRWVEARS